VMGVIVPLFLTLELKKRNLLQSLEKRLCCGIKDWSISEKRDFDYYRVKVLLEKIVPSLVENFEKIAKKYIHKKSIL
jgi:hypothetical protein